MVETCSGTDSGYCTDVAEAAQAAAELGFPVVVKGHGVNLAHKSEPGTVAVNLKDERTVEDAATAILTLPGVEQLLVEAMITDGRLRNSYRHHARPGARPGPRHRFRRHPD